MPLASVEVVVCVLLCMVSLPAALPDCASVLPEVELCDCASLCGMESLLASVLVVVVVVEDWACASAGFCGATACDISCGGLDFGAVLSGVALVSGEVLAGEDASGVAVVLELELAPFL